MKWISVNDRLPEEFESVLAVGKLRGDIKKTVNECYLSKNKWWPSKSTTIHQVTHWMPLPNPPIESESV